MQASPSDFLSIIVPTYQRAAQIQSLLSWLFEQTIDRSRSELIIIDDGSTDHTTEILREAAAIEPWLRPLRQDNKGQAAARQAGVEHSRGGILLFLDDDMEPATPDFLEAHRSFHAQHAHPCVALGSILPPPGDGHRPAFEYFYEKSIRRMYEGFASGREKPAGKHFFSANVSLPKQLFRAVGGFDASYRHAEDRELGLRLEKARASFAHLPAAGAFHHSPTGTYKAFVRRAELYGSYDLKMARLYPERPDLHPKTQFDHPSRIRRQLAILVWNRPQLPLLANQILARSAEAIHQMGLTFLAVPLCSVLYTMNYIRGYRLEALKSPDIGKDSPHAA